MPHGGIHFEICFGDACFLSWPGGEPPGKRPPRRRPPGGGRTPPTDPPPTIPPDVVPPPTIVPVTVPPPATFPPIPQTRPPFGGFPTGPAANDPVFKIPGKFGTVGRLLGAFGYVYTAAEILAMIYQQILKREAFEKEQDAKRERQAARDREPTREVEFPDSAFPASDFPPNPQVSRPPRPGNLPDSPLPRPSTFPESLPDAPGFPMWPITFPVPRPAAPQIPRRTSPQPSDLPDRVYRQLPGSQPNPFPYLSPFFLPRTSPRTQPLSDPIPSAPPGDLLTPPQPGGLPSPPGNPFVSLFNQPGTSPQPQTAQQRCEVVKRRKRKKGQCRVGYFRETPESTTYTTWRTKKCGTPKLKIVE